ncbi:MAG: hypothetical protein SV422_09815 [Pseudomonadota bacterium]|nr:hypothetical protein [Pseudomonadota bacterium]
MRRVDGGSIGRRRARGFSLFEMVVTICSIVILYMVAEQRLNDLPAAAERANFHAVLQQIKAGVNFEMIKRLAEGRSDQMRQLEGTNPMNFLIETPSNYGGELVSVTDAVRRRNAWYYETSTGQLVYVVGGSSIDDVQVVVAGVPVRLGQIRFRITNVYGNGGGDFQGLVLTPVNPYNWVRRLEDASALN